MTNNDKRLFGDQFDESRFKQGQEADEIVRSTLMDAFEARNITAVEGEEAFDNFAENKAIRQIMDYSGIDYLVDTFDSPAFGVNHRNHFNERASRFDIRVDTGSTAPSELDKLQKAGRWDIVPKYATRMKVPDGEVEWFRVIDLHTFVESIENDGLSYDMDWDDYDSGVTAWMYDYDELRERDIVVDEFEP
jgi:hypothetical protein